MPYGNGGQEMGDRPRFPLAVKWGTDHVFL